MHDYERAFLNGSGYYAFTMMATLPYLLLALLPWPCVWLGLHFFKSVTFTFALYHGFCLLPVIVGGRRHWRRHLILPSTRQLLFMFVASVVCCGLAAALYLWLGDALIGREHALLELEKRGWTRQALVPLIIYFLTINPVLEELFWRGVILNGICDKHGHLDIRIEALVAFAFAAWHYVILQLFFRPIWAEIIVLGITAVGGILSFLYRRYRSLVLPILWHSLVFDALVVVVLLLLLR